MATIADFKYVFASIDGPMPSLDYINRFRKFRDRLKEELGEKDESIIIQHWLAYLEHFICMCEDCEGSNHPPDISYVPQWPDRFDPNDEDEDGNGLIP